MGYTILDAAVAVALDFTIDRLGLVARVEEWRASLPAEWQPLVVGPIPSVVNGYYTWFFAPDGSKSGWEEDTEGDRLRAEFAALFADAYADVVTLEAQFGADSRGEHPPLIRYLPRKQDDDDD